MNIYSRALRHIDIEDVKQKNQEKIVEKKINEEKESQKKEYIALVMEEKRFDCRKDLGKGTDQF